MAQRNGFGKVFVEIESAGDCAGNLADFESVGQAGNIVVAERRYEDLRLVLQPPERLAVDYAVTVTLVLGADIGRRLGDGTPGGTAGLRREWGEVLFSLFKTVADS